MRNAPTREWASGGKGGRGTLTLEAEQLVEAVLEVELRRPRVGRLHFDGNVLAIVEVLACSMLPLLMRIVLRCRKRRGLWSKRKRTQTELAEVARANLLADAEVGADHEHLFPVAAAAAAAAVARRRGLGPTAAVLGLRRHPGSAARLPPCEMGGKGEKKREEDGEPRRRGQERAKTRDGCVHTAGPPPLGFLCGWGGRNREERIRVFDVVVR